MTQTEPKQTLEELRVKIEPLIEGYVGRKLKHLKTTSWYTVTGFFFKEDDMSIWFTYQTMHRSPVPFARPLAELFDGRFQIS